jgi:nucleotide-binding universal stress UspA family protein
MARIRRLLFPTDFSEGSRQAIAPTVALARQFDAAITLVYVLPTTFPAEFSHLGLNFEAHRLTAESQRSLAAFRERELPPDISIQAVVKEGGAPFQIAETAREVEADLIVLSTHGYTGLKHALLGSTAERVVRHAPCPVLVFRATPVPVQFPDDPQVRFKRILVPTDFSEASEKAMRYAAALGAPHDAAYHLLHVIEPPPYPEFGYAHVPTREAALRAEAMERLNTASHRALGPELVARTQTCIRTGRASFEIATEARETHSDLIIIGTHGHSALKTMLLGSTAEEVVRYAPVPVLVVREREHEFVSQAANS